MTPASSRDETGARLGMRLATPLGMTLATVSSANPHGYRVFRLVSNVVNPLGSNPFLNPLRFKAPNLLRSYRARGSYSPPCSLRCARWLRAPRKAMCIAHREEEEEPMKIEVRDLNRGRSSRPAVFESLRLRRYRHARQARHIQACVDDLRGRRAGNSTVRLVGRIPNGDALVCTWLWP